jgi:hypothetical protein
MMMKIAFENVKSNRPVCERERGIGRRLMDENCCFDLGMGICIAHCSLLINTTATASKSGNQKQKHRRKE